MDEDLLRIFRTKLKDEFLSDCTSIEGWKIKEKTDNLVISSKFHASFSRKKIKTIKAISVIENANAAVVFNYLMDPAVRKVWDPTCIENKSIYKIGNDGDILYYAMDLPLPLSPRDLVLIRFWDCSSDNFFLYQSSVVHKRIPEKSSFVRAKSKVSGFSVQETNTGVVITFVTNVHVKGFIPGFLLNKSARKACFIFFNHLIAEFKKYSQLDKNNAKDSCYIKPEVIFGDSEELDVMDIEDFLIRSTSTDHSYSTSNIF